MKNKRAILMPETLKIVIAVVCIFFLFYLGKGYAGIFFKSTASKQAEDSLEKIYSAVEKVKSDGKEVEIFLESPNDWGVSAWSENDKDNLMKCEKEKESCVCICEFKNDDLITSGFSKYLENCNSKNKGYCKGVSVKIEIESDGVWQYDDLISIDSSTSLKIYKKGEEIIIEEI